MCYNLIIKFIIYMAVFLCGTHIKHTTHTNGRLVCLSATQKKEKDMVLDACKGIFHSHPNIVYRGNNLCLSVAISSTYHAVKELVLKYRTEGDSGSLQMELCTSNCEYAVYSATIKKEAFDRANILDYSINDGVFTLFDYEVKVVDKKKLPAVIINEVHPATTKRVPWSRYIELTNISDKKVDLYSYRLTLFIEDKARTGYITDKEGCEFIQPHETVVIRYLVAESFDANGNVYMSDEEFVKAIFKNEIYKGTDNIPSEFGGIRVIDVNNTEISEKTGLLETNEDFMPNVSFEPERILLSRRDGSKSEDDFEISLNKSYSALDTMHYRSILTNVDPLCPNIGKVIMRDADPTPGILDIETPIPDLSCGNVPLIVITSPQGSHIMSDGELKIEYSVIPSGVYSYAEIYSGDKVKKKNARSVGEGRYEIVIDKSTVESTKKLRFALFADNGAFVSSLGDKDIPLEITIKDNVGPSVKMISPKPDFCYSGVYKPTISGYVYDVSGVDTYSSKIFIDDLDITDDVVWKKNTFTYEVKKELSEGDHKVRFKLFDLLGNISKLSSPFAIANKSKMNCYFGEVHNHTGVSDGQGTPAEAYTYARDVVGLDYFAVTDHSHYLLDERYDDEIAVANSFNVPGRFAALYGWEMTWTNKMGWWGHLNVIGSEGVIVDRTTCTFGRICEWMKKNGGVGMLNHPGYVWGNFNEYASPAEISNENVCLAEIKGTMYDSEYTNMLKKGYHVSPVYNDDAHVKAWGNLNNYAGCVLAPSLSRENVLEAFRSRRTYSTSDRKLKLKFSINGEWMGSTLTDPEKLNVSVEVSTESEDGIGKLQLMTKDSVVVKEINVGVRQSYKWCFTVDPLFPFYYVRIVGLNKYSVTSPIWIQNTESIKLSTPKIESSANEQKPITLSFELLNDSSEVMTNVKTDVYITPRSGVVLGDEPYLTIYTDKIKPGYTERISRTIPSVSGNRLVTVITRANGKSKGKYYAAVDSVNATQLLIAEVMPLTSPVTKVIGSESVTIKDPFSYVKLYNNSCRDISLDFSNIALWKASGKGTTDGTTADLSGSTIKARSTLVIWQRPKKSDLTVDDFNERYKTDLILGTDIIITDKTIVSSSDKSVFIELSSAGEVLSRVSYNYCMEEPKNEVEEDVSLHYAYSPNITATATRLINKKTPKPGTVYVEQKASFVSGEPKKSEQKSEKKAEKAKKNGNLREKNGNIGKSIGTGISIISGITAAGAVIGSVVSKPKKVTVKTESVPSADSIKAQEKVLKKSEKRIVKGVSKEVSKQINTTVDKKISKASSAKIDERISDDKQAMKQAKKNIKALKARKKADKQLQKREKELKKLRGY